MTARRCVLFVDGSSVALDSRNRADGWGLVALHDDTHVERSGGLHERHGEDGWVILPSVEGPESVGEALVNAGRRDRTLGYHEHIAVLEGIRYAHAAGFEPSDVTLYCDDKVFGHAHTRLHPANYTARLAEFVRHRAAVLCTTFYPSQPDLEPLLLEYLQGMRTLVIKGHNRFVLQERVDYLARCAAWATVRETPSAALTYEHWLTLGLPDVDEEGNPRRWYAPFVSALDPPFREGAASADRPVRGDSPTT